MWLIAIVNVRKCQLVLSAGVLLYTYVGLIFKKIIEMLMLFKNTKNSLRTLGLSLLGAALLSACGGGGSCAGCAPSPTPTPNPGELTLKLTAPNQYPAGVAVTAYLTMTNTSAANATNLFYDVPSVSNYTGATITVLNGAANNPCVNIAAGQSCTFPATISANSHPGSFTVTATPNGSASVSSVKKLWNNLRSDLGLQASTLSLTANIGLTDLPANSNSGANGISFLYSNVVSANESGETLISVVAVVNSAEAGSFNTINLTDQNGNLLNFDVLSGNSGNGATNLSLGSIVTFLLRIPASAANSTFDFYAQTSENGSLVSQGTNANPITVGAANSGALVIQPTGFSLTAPNAESQIVTFTNIGNGSISSLIIPTPASPLYQISNNCGSTLAAGASCIYILGSHVEPGVSGNAGFTASYNNGSTINSVSAQVYYAGLDPVAGISVNSGDNPDLNFVANTENNTVSSILTLTNTGNVNESNFVFTVPQYFILSAGSSGTPCTLSGNVVTSVLSKNSSCNLTLSYTNGTLTSGSKAAKLLVDYKYHGVDAPQSDIPLTYQTVQASGLLQVNPASYTYPNIRANGNMSESKVFVYTNIGTGSTTNIVVNSVLQAPAVFRVVPSSPSVANDCGSNITSLAPGAQCQVTVKFGQAYTPGTYNKTLQVSYESIPAATPVIIPATISGTVLPALSADIIVSNVSFSPAALGGNGSSQESGFAFESSTSPISVTLTYKNIGDDAASNFIASSSLYTISSNNCNNITLPISGTCTITINYSNNSSAVDDEIHLDSMYIPLSWSDDSGTYSNQGAQWDNNGTPQGSIFINIFAQPQVSALMSYESNGNNPISSVNVESDFYVVYTLSGGYKVGNLTYGVNLSNAQGGTPLMSIYSPTTCTLSGNQPTCYIKLNAGGAAQTQSIGYTTTGNVAPTPASSGSFNVSMPGCGGTGRNCIFITNFEYGYSGKLNDGGGRSGIPGIPASSGESGADAICQYEAYQNGSVIPAGKTFKAMILAENRTPCGSLGCGESVGAGFESGWVVGPNTSFYTTDGSFFMTSNSSGVFQNSYAQDQILDSKGESVTTTQEFWMGMSWFLIESSVNQSPIPAWTAIGGSLNQTAPSNNFWLYGGGNGSGSVANCSNWTSISPASGYVGDNGQYPDSMFGNIALLYSSYGYFSAPAAGSTQGVGATGVRPTRWNDTNLYSCSLGKALICVQQ